MDRNSQTFIRCRILVNSPVHLGCDEVYEPTGFVMDGEQDQLRVFDPTDFIAGLSQQDQAVFSAICRKGNVASILEIYKFLQNRPVDGLRVEVCNDFKNHYQQVLQLPLGDERKIQQELNRFLIERTAFTPHDSRPFIPGSAVKGAFRTAYLNLLNAEVKAKSYEGKDAHKKLESYLLQLGEKPFETDPFRLVKVSDFRPVGFFKTKIIYAVNRKKKLSQYEARGPYQILEVLEPGASFIGTITIDSPDKKAPIRTPITVENLWKSLAQFYGYEKDREDEELKAVNVKPIEIKVADDRHLIRLGRYSGAECLTVDGHRKIKIMQSRGEKPKNENHATTLWLASESRNPESNQYLRPFGWCVLEELSEEQWRGLEKEESEYKHQQAIELAEKLDQERETRARIAAEERARKEQETRLAEERRRQEEEQARRQAELEAMTPAQKDAATLKELGDSPQDEQLSMEIYKRLANYEGKEKIDVAIAVKKYWSRIGKWSGKQSSKQKAKILDIRGILDEA